MGLEEQNAEIDCYLLPCSYLDKSPNAKEVLDLLEAILPGCGDCVLFVGLHVDLPSTEQSCPYHVDSSSRFDPEQGDSWKLQPDALES